MPFPSKLPNRHLSVACVLGASLLAPLAVACGDDDAVIPLTDSGVRADAADPMGDAQVGDDDAGGDSDDAATPSDGGLPDPDSGIVLPPLQAFADLPEGEWSELFPQGATTCARGTPFAFYVYKGSTDDVVFDFIGGGACWNDLTCGLGASFFSDSVAPVRAMLADGDGDGLMAMRNPDNPVMGYTHVVVPYCTGDVHWGDAEHTYGTGADMFTLQHRGAVNARAVLDWMVANIPAPTRMLTTGCSAGGYGSVLWATHAMHAYPATQHYHFSDSAAGIITDTFFMDSFPVWNARAGFPDFIEGFDPMAPEQLPALYIAFAGAFPDALFSQYNTVADRTQSFFYTAMGGEGGEAAWETRMRASLDTIRDVTPNFRTFLAPGDKHCTIQDPGFYTDMSNGVKVADWIDGMLAGDPVENVDVPGGS